MTPTEFCNRYGSAAEPKHLEYTTGHATMADAWDACAQPDWLFWVLHRHVKPSKRDSVRLALAFAEACPTVDLPEDGHAARDSALRAVRAWLDDPSPETESMARHVAGLPLTERGDPNYRSARAAIDTARVASWPAGTSLYLVECVANAHECASRRTPEIDALRAGAKAEAARIRAETKDAVARGDVNFLCMDQVTALADRLDAALAPLVADIRAEQCDIIRSVIPNPFL